jgi:hypothetical protein
MQRHGYRARAPNARRGQRAESALTITSKLEAVEPHTIAILTQLFG